MVITIKKLALAFFIGGLLSVSTISYGQNAKEELSSQYVLRSSLEHFPSIQQALLKVEETKGALQSATGVFDATLNNTYYRRQQGFYSGRFNNTEIVKPLDFYNAEVAVGYRQSDGSFPVYQDYFFTNSGGEVSLRVAFSLLRDRDIDTRRFSVFKETMALDQAVIETFITKMTVQSKALKTYIDWVAAGKRLSVYKELLNIALQRDDALRKRLKQEDVARIAVTENQQFIYQREAAVAKAERDFRNASNQLSLFVRHEDSTPRLVDASLLPQNFPSLAIDKIDWEDSAIIKDNPELRKIENQLAVVEKRIELGENDLQPKLDFELYNARDFGSGSLTREGYESTFTLNVSVPLQRNLGLGQIRKGRALAQQLEFEKQLTQEQIKLSFDNIMNDIKALEEILVLTGKEVEVAAQMKEAEDIRFKNGQSDFFLLNIREVNNAQAQIKNIDAKQAHLSAAVDYFVATIDFTSLGIKVDAPF